MKQAYIRAVKKFTKDADWLTSEHAPILVHLETLARQLDQQLDEDGKPDDRTAALFGTTWNRLKKPVSRATQKDEESDSDFQFS